MGQLAGPAGFNFSAAIHRSAGSMDAGETQRTGSFYAQLLNDLDALVATDSAFQLGPWLAMAKGFATEIGVEDCVPSDPAAWPTITSCLKFYEWNARSQLTTWKPTPLHSKILSGPVDYASKHWSGLIRDYYSARVDVVMKQALYDASFGVDLDQHRVDELLGEHAYNWTTAVNEYPTAPVGDFVEVSKAMKSKYHGYFLLCGN